ncbi:MAG: hypothetical protein MR401_02890, partial [Bacteroidales bacterium]|nr:hypothetical protein [Bacteroidales bacterium]
RIILNERTMLCTTKKRNPLPFLFVLLSPCTIFAMFFAKTGCGSAKVSTGLPCCTRPLDEKHQKNNNTTHYINGIQFQRNRKEMAGQVGG